MDYLSLNVQLASFITMPILWHDDVAVDESYQENRMRLRVFLNEFDVEEGLLDLLFIEETLSTPGFGDGAYVAWLLTIQRTDLGMLLRDRYLDFYQIEYCLRRGEFPMVQAGTLWPLIQTRDEALKRVLNKSDYAKQFAIIDGCNALKKFDECVFLDMVYYQHVGIGVDGVIAKVMIYLLRLKQASILEKGRRQHIDTQKIARDF